MEKLLGELTTKLQKSYGERLVSVVLYGSGAAGDHHARFSDLNVLCVLTEVTPRELSAGEPIFRWWRSQGSPSPLLLSESEFQKSADTFPIEYHDIRREHRVLYGKSIVEGVPLDDSFYRAQVEHDLRAKFLRLRQKTAGILSDSDLLRRLLADSVSTFCVLFRHALILHGEDPPATKRDIISRAAARFGLDAAPFSSILDLREGRVKPREVRPDRLVGPYLQAIGVVIDAVDRLEK